MFTFYDKLISRVSCGPYSAQAVLLVVIHSVPLKWGSLTYSFIQFYMLGAVRGGRYELLGATKRILSVRPDIPVKISTNQLSSIQNDKRYSNFRPEISNC